MAKGQGDLLGVLRIGRVWDEPGFWPMKIWGSVGLLLLIGVVYVKGQRRP